MSGAVSAESKFTKGPWRVGCGLEKICTDYRDERDYTKNGFAKAICKVSHPAYRDINESVANAQLIATAPELYEELETARSIIVDLEGWSETSENVKSIDAVLAKARGEE